MPKHVSYKTHRIDFSLEDLRRALMMLVKMVPEIPKDANIELYTGSERAVSIRWEERDG